MKKILLLLTYILFNCGVDGENGSAYLSFSWDWYVDSYTDNNSGVPYSISEYDNYEVSSGTYSYEYHCSDGEGNYWGYEGHYTIEINEGEKGSLITDGSDGDDNYFRMNLTGNGLSFYLKKNKDKKSKIIQKEGIDIKKFRKEYVGKVWEEEIVSQNGKMTITKQKFQLLEF